MALIFFLDSDDTAVTVICMAKLFIIARTTHCQDTTESLRKGHLEV